MKHGLKIAIGQFLQDIGRYDRPRSEATKTVSDLSSNIYTQQKKLRNSQKTTRHKNTKANNYSFFIYLFRYMSSVEKNVYFSLLASIPLLWHSVK